VANSYSMAPSSTVLIIGVKKSWGKKPAGHGKGVAYGGGERTGGPYIDNLTNEHSPKDGRDGW